MPIVPLYGHQTLRQRLLAGLGNGALPHSLLFHGPAGTGKQRLGLWLASALLCDGDTPPCGSCRHCRYLTELTHPDFTWVFPRPRLKDADASADDVKRDLADAVADRVKAHGLYAAPPGNEGIYVPVIRMLVRMASVTPALARRKVLLVGDAERMVSQEGADQAANAFLKLLEEPPADTHVILTTSAPGSLLPTIRSRVIAMRVGPLAPADVAAWLRDEQVASQLEGRNLPEGETARIALAAGSPGRLLEGREAKSAESLARKIVDAARAGDREQGIRLALSAGAAGARGAYSDMLDAITLELHSLVKAELARGNEPAAYALSRGFDAVEEAKALAYGNNNPQLITARLFDRLLEVRA